MFEFAFNSLIPLLIADANRHSARILLAIFSFLVKDNYCLIEQRTWADCHDTVANFLKQLGIKIDRVKTFYLRWIEY